LIGFEIFGLVSLQ